MLGCIPLPRRDIRLCERATGRSILIERVGQISSRAASFTVGSVSSPIAVMWRLSVLYRLIQKAGGLSLRATGARSPRVCPYAIVDEADYPRSRHQDGPRGEGSANYCTTNCTIGSAVGGSLKLLEKSSR